MTSALSIMGIGMLGIFLVTGVIILVVTLLNKLFSK
ncbi:MAG: oxaloacetate decarboxylase [Oscillospiraceae bacterium]|nr:oxaloacetate decarboxylase [Oscillospiraceae bacterium]